MNFLFVLSAKKYSFVLKKESISIGFLSVFVSVTFKLVSFGNEILELPLFEITAKPEEVIELYIDEL